MDVATHYTLLFMLYAKIVIATMIIPIIVATARFAQLNRSLKIFWGYLSLDFLVAFAAQLFIWATKAYKDFFKPILEKLNIHDTNFISIFNYLTTFLLLGWYFHNVFESKRMQLLVKIITIILFFSTILEGFVWHDFREFSSINATIYTVFCLFMPSLHLWFVYNKMTIAPLSKNPYFWLNLGLILPNIIGLFLDIIGNQLFLTDKTLFYEIFIAKYYFVILAQLLYAVGFYFARYTKFLPERW
jgi:hypothetical protein